MADEIVQNPTYAEHVRHFFDEIDLDHMMTQGVDLSTYPNLVDRAADVYLITLQPDGQMPPEPDRKWSAERSATFLNWINDGMPVGVPTAASAQPTGATRIRKDARDLSTDEIETLQRAMQGVMDRDPADPTSYFGIASIHWYPPPNECKHHNDLYHPWHRTLLQHVEDILRGVPGCEDVTIPYWDVTARPPDFLFAAPFDSYTAQRDIFPPQYPAGYQTMRFDADTIAANAAADDIATQVQAALGKFRWSDFNQTAWGAHDEGHPACGATMAVPDVASFDPIFWFFHSYWDRLWWQWQQAMQATTVWTFRSTIFGSPAFLEPPLNGLSPFTTLHGTTADMTIDLSAAGIDYAPHTEPTPIEPQPLAFGSLAIRRGVRAQAQQVASVRLKGVNRLAIPGTFRTTLRADGQEIAHKTFFQSTRPATCENCLANPLVDVTFEVAPEAVLGRALTTDVTLLDTTNPRTGTFISPRACGDPTLNVRLLLVETS